jgi:hypothetical protein
MAIASITFLPVFAGTGGIRIDPPLPEGTTSPAVFKIWVQGKSTANDIHIFLVMTEASYEAFSGNVEVTWEGGSATIPKGDDWTKETVNSVKVPPETTNGAGYTVASLKDHLDTIGPIYWAFADLWDDGLGSSEETITVTLPSTDPNMLVYILGKSGKSPKFDMRVPPTIPGFVVPEVPLGTAATILAMAAAFLLRSRSKIY